MVQQAAVKIHAPGGEQRPSFPVGVAPVDSHQAAFREGHTLEARTREQGQAEVTAGEGAGLKDAGFKGAFRQGTMGEDAVLKGEGLKRLPLGGQVVDPDFCIVGCVEKGHAASVVRMSGVTASRHCSERRNPGW